MKNEIHDLAERVDGMNMNLRRKEDFDWKYGEGPVLKDLEEHIKSTYSSHYTSTGDDIQTIDVFAYRGTLATTSIDNAIKYLMRYGKKKGKNELDLVKAMHYLILAVAFERKQEAVATITAKEEDGLAENDWSGG